MDTVKIVILHKQLSHLDTKILKFVPRLGMISNEF